MAAPQIFKVLTEFRFEAGSAIATSGQLASAVDQVSSSADQALISFKKLSIGIVSGYLAGPGGGILGVLGTAIDSSEQFLKTQVALANIMGRTSGSFASRMQFAEKSMLKIKGLASEFGLPAKELVGVTKIVAPGLKPSFGPQGAIEQGANLGRNFLKAAPALGIDPAEGLDNLQRAVFGTINAGDSLFRILTQDTKAMAEFANKGAKFRALDLPKRVQLLNSAFEEFSKDLSSVDRLVNSVGGQFRIFKENLIGMFSVLRPLGDLTGKIVVQALKRMNELIDGPLRRSIENVTMGIAPFTQNLDSLIATFFQLKNLSGDAGLAGNLLLLTSAMIGLRFAAVIIQRKFGVGLPLLNLGLRKFHRSILFLEGSALAGMKAMFKFATSLRAVRAVAIVTGAFAGLAAIFAGGFAAGIVVVVAKFKVLFGFFNKAVILISRFLGPLTLLVLVFQVLSRAVGFFKIAAAGKIALLVEKLSEVFTMFGMFFGILSEGVDVIARLLATSPLFDALFGIAEFGVDVLHSLGTGLIRAVAGFQGLTFALMEMFQVLATFGKGSAAFKGDIGEAFQTGVDDIFSKTLFKLESGDFTAGVTQNIQKLEMRNDFKQQLEPDRIAFTIEESLRKLAANPKQATASAGQRRNFGASGSF